MQRPLRTTQLSHDVCRVRASNRSLSTRERMSGCPVILFLEGPSRSNSTRKNPIKGTVGTTFDDDMNQKSLHFSVAHWQLAGGNHCSVRSHRG